MSFPQEGHLLASFPPEGHLSTCKLPSGKTSTRKLPARRPGLYIPGALGKGTFVGTSHQGFQYIGQPLGQFARALD
jgi:hypothetical protein